MKKRIAWILVVALVAVGGYFGYRFLSRRAARQAALANIRNGVSTAVVERRDLEVVVTGKGTVKANAEETIQPGVSGTVSQVLVKEGDSVKAGDPILILSNSSVVSQADQANLDLELAKKSLEDLTGPAGGRAKAELDLKQAQKNLSDAQSKVDSLSVKSPIRGTVWTMSVKPGDDVKAGQTIAVIGDNSAFKVDAKVRQQDVTDIKIGTAVTVSPGGDIASMSGTVISVGTEGTAGSKGVEFPVTIEITDPSVGLRPGMAVNVNYPLAAGDLLTLPGTVAAVDRQEVKAEVDGTVTEVLVSEGDPVIKDQVIMRAENDSLLLALDKAKNDLEVASQNLASFDNQISQQKLKVEQAEVNAKDKNDSVSKLTVRSPIDGKVVTLGVQTGDQVNATQNVATVSQVNPLTVVIPVDELDILNVRVGQSATVEVDALPGQVLDGVVQKIAQEGTVQQGITNYNVVVQLNSDAPKLGMSATATISVDKKTAVLTVPVEAVKWDSGQAYVNQNQNGQVVRKKIKVGSQNDLYAEVVSGLEEGESILVGDIPTSSTGLGLGSLRIPNGVPRTNFPAQAGQRRTTGGTGQ